MRSPLRPAALGGAGLALALLASCSVGGGADGAPAAVGPSRAPSVAPPATASAEPAPPACVPAPLPVRAAAVLVVGMPGVTTVDQPLAQDVVALGVGGVFLSRENVVSAEQVTALAAGLRAASSGPLLVSTDEESGRVAVMRELVGGGPSPRRLADERSAADVEEFALGVGERLAALGVDLDLAPVLDLDDGPSNGAVGDRAFSGEPDEAAAYGLAFARGLSRGGVLPTVKHFPGLGRAGDDTHTGSALVETSLEELRATDLAPFQAAVDAGAPVVMLGHARYSAIDADLPASVSPATYRLLREMGFDGVAITDSLGMGAVNLRFDFPEAAVRAVAAGTDAVLATDGNQAPRMRDALVAAVQEGRLPEERLSEAAARVTALAGGDPQAMSCLDVDLPGLG